MLWPPNTPGAQEAEGDIQQLTPTPKNNTQGLGEQMQSRNEVTQRYLQIYVSPTSNTNFLTDTGNNTTHMVFEGELAAELPAKDVEVGTNSDRNHDKTKSPWRGPTVLDLLMTKDLVLLGFSIMQQ